MPSAERRAEALPPAEPLSAEDERLPEDLRSLLRHARNSWLPNTAVLSLLTCHRSCGLEVDREPPSTPTGGSVFLYDRANIRSFRRDGHNWKKKRDGRTVKETHEKLKVDNKDMLNCYYAHPEQEGCPQRRCYWQLDSTPDIVLVHYLVVDRYRSGNAEYGGSATQGSSSPGQSCGSVQGLSFKEVPEDSAVEQSLRRFEPRSDLFDATSSALDLGSASMVCGMEMLSQPEAAMLKGHALDDDSAYNLLPSFDNFPGPQVQAGNLMGLSSVVVDSDSAKLVKEEVPHSGVNLPGMWSGNYFAGPQRQHEAMSLVPRSHQPASPSNAMPSIFDPSDFMDIPGDPDNELPVGGLGYPPVHESMRFSPGQRQTQGADRRAPRQLSARRHSSGSRGVELRERPPVSNSNCGPNVWGPQGMPPTSLPHPELNPHQPFLQAMPAFSQPEFSFSTHPSSRDYSLPIPEPRPGSSKALTSPFESKHSAPPNVQRRSVDTNFKQPLKPVVTHHMLDARSTRSVSMDMSMKSVTTPFGSVRWADREADDSLGHAMRRARKQYPVRPQDFEADVADLKTRGLSDMDAGFEHMLPEQVEVPAHGLGSPVALPKDLSRNMSAPNPLSDADLFTSDVALQDLQDNTSSTVQMRLNASPELTIRQSFAYRLLEEYAPSWDYTTGGAKMILICRVNDVRSPMPANASLHVAFDQQEVLATVISAGVIKVEVPPHAAGQVNCVLTFGDRQPVSNSVPFQYRPLPGANTSQMQSLSLGSSDRDLQLHLIKMLTGGGSQSNQQSGGYTAGDSFGGQHGYTTRALQGQSSEGSSLSANERRLSQMSSAQLEKQLQRFIEKNVLQHTVKSMGDGKLGVRDLADIRRRELFMCGVSGKAGLHLLAGLGYDLALDTLLSADADPSSKDANGYTPLHWAAARGKVLTVALLAARKADVDATAQNSSPQLSETAADLASESGHLGVAAFLGELQLRQGILRLSEKLGPETPQGQEVTMQRKRSRHLSPLLDVTSEYLNSCHEMQPSDSAFNEHGLESPCISTSSEEDSKDVHSIVSRAKRNARHIEAAALRKQARHINRQQRKSRTSPRLEDGLGILHSHNAILQSDDMHPDNARGSSSMLERPKNPFLDTDMGSECRLDVNLYSDDGFANLPAVSALHSEAESLLATSFMSGSAGSSGVHSAEGSFTRGSGCFSIGLSEDTTECNLIPKALGHIERLATSHAATIQEYMYVRQAARMWLETKSGLGITKYARHSGPSMNC